MNHFDHKKLFAEKAEKMPGSDKFPYMQTQLFQTDVKPINIYTSKKRVRLEKVMLPEGNISHNHLRLNLFTVGILQKVCFSNLTSPRVIKTLRRIKNLFYNINIMWDC